MYLKNHPHSKKHEEQQIVKLNLMVLKFIMDHYLNQVSMDFVKKLIKIENLHN